ncbi:MAG: DinB family protein [Acidobacteriota bacterium]
MFRTMDDFFSTWKTESDATLKIFNALSDSALDQKVYQDGRTVYTLAWHIAKSLGQMMEHAGLKIDAPPANGQVPHKALKICEAYEHLSASLVKALKKNWNDQMLTEEVPMYGESWPRSGVLFALITHQIHHRGQLTVLMRQAGLKVPGIYGPSREEWAAFGMEPQE